MKCQFFSKTWTLLLGAILVCFSRLPFPAHAAGMEPTYRAVLDSGSLNNAKGVMSVNMAAGENNQQVNARAISVVPGAIAVTANQIEPITENDHQFTRVTKATVRIEGGTFRNATGVIGVNQISGYGNRQANTFALGAGQQGEILSDNALSGNLAATDVLGKSERSAGVQRAASVDDNAFRGARGFVQINQTAGSGNRSANNLGIRLLSGSSN